MKYLYNPPLLVKSLFSSFIWNSKNEKVLFTFDDGPVPNNTERILKKLDEHNIKAVFFCVGNNIMKNRGLADEILHCGHTIANHTMNHRILTGLDEIEITKEIIPFNMYMEDEFGYEIKYFRPPHGKFNIKLAGFIKQSKLRCVMWSLLTYDYRNNIEEIKKSLKFLRKDSVIVLHDSIKSKYIINEAIELICERINKQQFHTGTPSECLK